VPSNPFVATTEMPAVETLASVLACVGRWRGTCQLWTSPDNPPVESTSTIMVTAVASGLFVRIDQAWAWHGAPQEGSILLGCEADAGLATAYRADTFHMGRKVMACTVHVTDDGIIDVRGTYAVPPGPPRGWRIQGDRM
jgi:hypothetical protein